MQKVTVVSCDLLSCLTHEPSTFVKEHRHFNNASGCQPETHLRWVGDDCGRRNKLQGSDVRSQILVCPVILAVLSFVVSQVDQ